jgi:uncharacterized protein DUF1559
MTIPACGKEMTIPDSAAIQKELPPLRTLAPDDENPRPVSPQPFEDDRPLPVLRGRLDGQGRAITGLVTGLFSLLLVGLLALLFLLLPAVQSMRDAEARVRNSSNLTQIIFAMHGYQDAHHKLPPAVVFDANGRPLHSWRVLILPFMEQNVLFQQFHLDEPWDSPHNRQFLKAMPAQLAHPNDPDGAEAGLTHYQGFAATGPEQPSPIFSSTTLGMEPFLIGLPNQNLFASRSLNMKGGLPDGVSNTIFVTEAEDAVPWTKPVDMPYSPTAPLPRLKRLSGGFCCFGMGDGSVHFINLDDISERTLRDAITANDGQLLGSDWR